MPEILIFVVVAGVACAGYWAYTHGKLAGYVQHVQEAGHAVAGKVSEVGGSIASKFADAGQTPAVPPIVPVPDVPATVAPPAQAAPAAPAATPYVPEVVHAVVTQLASSYASRAVLLECCTVGNYLYAVLLDGEQVHNGFGPADSFYTQPDMTVSTTPVAVA